MPIINFDNSGTYWSNIEMQTLSKMVSTGRTWEDIARVLRRSVGACKQRYGMIRCANMFFFGKPEDTVQSYYAKKEEFKKEFYAKQAKDKEL